MKPRRRSPNQIIKLHDISLKGSRREFTCAIGTGILSVVGAFENVLHASEDSGTVGTVAFVGAIGLALCGSFYDKRLERTSQQLAALQEQAMVGIRQSFEATLPLDSDTSEHRLPENPDGLSST